jgi:hypothetical protein
MPIICFTEYCLADTLEHMFKRRSAENLTFYGVALFIILVGIAILAVGLVQLAGQMLWEWQFGWPMAKVMAGMVILSLGYVVLELELLRRNNK